TSSPTINRSFSASTDSFAGTAAAAAAAAAVKPNIAASLSYGASFILGILWLPVPIFFLLKSPYKTNQLIRFHAFQAILLVAGLFVVSLTLNVLFGLVLSSPPTGFVDQQGQRRVFAFTFLDCLHRANRG
ncbi:MAG: hypothetical protein M3384_06130, partial [Acidobacteriota bacterium]|nr:hypothetical protein [Acidobacteriota bacterium]